MGKNGRDRLAEALEALQTLQDAGPCYAIKGMKTRGEVNSRMFLENGFLEEVIKGWYIPSTPSHVGTTTTWYASFWGFVAAYCDSRFGTGWTLTPEESLSICRRQWAHRPLYHERVVDYVWLQVESDSR